MGCLFSAWKTINGATGRFSLLQFPYIGGPHRPARPFLGAGPAYFKPPQTPGRPPFPGWHFLENSLPGALAEGWPGPLFRAVSAFRPRAGPGILPVAPAGPAPYIRRPPRAAPPRFLEPWPGRPRIPDASFSEVNKINRKHRMSKKPDSANAENSGTTGFRPGLFFPHRRRRRFLRTFQKIVR